MYIYWYILYIPIQNSYKNMRLWYIRFILLDFVLEAIHAYRVDMIIYAKMK